MTKGGSSGCRLSTRCRSRHQYHLCVQDLGIFGNKSCQMPLKIVTHDAGKRLTSQLFGFSGVPKGPGSSLFPREAGLVPSPKAIRHSIDALVTHLLEIVGG